MCVKAKFKNVTFDDFVLKYQDEYCDWSQICLPFASKHHISENLLDSAGQGVCGVEGCSNEADFYIDFPDGELEITKEEIIHG
jgi:hypothetical protein